MFFLSTPDSFQGIPEWGRIIIIIIITITIILMKERKGVYNEKEIKIFDHGYGGGLSIIFKAGVRVQCKP